MENFANKSNLNTNIFLLAQVLSRTDEKMN